MVDLPEDALFTRATELAHGRTFHKANGVRAYYEQLLLKDIPIRLVRGRRTATQSIAHETPTALAFTAADDYDPYNMHDAGGGNPSRFTAPVAGVYHVVAATNFANNATGIRQMWFHINGSTTAYWGIRREPAISGGEHCMSASADLLLAANDYVEAFVQQSSTVSLNAASNAGFPTFLAMHYAGQSVLVA